MTSTIVFPTTPVLPTVAAAAASIRSPATKVRVGSIENGEYAGSPAAAVYRTTKPFAVVHFEADGKGLIALLPAGAEVRIVGPSRIGKCLEVLYQNRHCNIFRVDLLGPMAVPVYTLPSRAKPVRARSAAAACA
jgi:hypothetical protein